MVLLDIDTINENIHIVCLFKSGYNNSNSSSEIVLIRFHSFEKSSTVIYIYIFSSSFSSDLFTVMFNRDKRILSIVANYICVSLAQTCVNIYNFFLNQKRSAFPSLNFLSFFTKVYCI